LKNVDPNPLSENPPLEKRSDCLLFSFSKREWSQIEKGFSEARAKSSRSNW
jgi:hypothetical protein